MKKILVVDDEADLCEMVSHSLAKSGEYTVLSTSQPESVLGICRQECPDLILLDIVMPNLKGTEIIQALKANPATARILIVVTSGLGEMVYEKKKEKWTWQPNRELLKDRGEVVREKSAARAAEAYGVDDYLAKPFSPQTLRQVVEEVLGRGPSGEDGGDDLDE